MGGCIGLASWPRGTKEGCQVSEARDLWVPVNVAYVLFVCVTVLFIKYDKGEKLLKFSALAIYMGKSVKIQILRSCNTGFFSFYVEMILKKSYRQLIVASTLTQVFELSHIFTGSVNGILMGRDHKDSQRGLHNQLDAPVGTLEVGPGSS